MVLAPSNVMFSKQKPSRLTRREWLQLGAGTLAALSVGRAHAKESTGKWTDDNIAEYSEKLFNWLKTNFATRAETLRNETGSEFKLNYDYMASAEDKKRQRLFEKFAEGRLSAPAAEKHIQACLSEFERIRTELAAAEAVAAEAWKAKADEVIRKDGMIYDTRVTAERLTVVLDNSPSMTPYLPKLRNEISRDFSFAYFAEVNGCSLTRDASYPWFFCGPLSIANPFTPERHIPKVPTAEERPYSTYIGWTRDTAGALECMVDLMKTDAIYWFCDFDDSSSDDVIKSIARKILAQETKLYIHTLRKKVPTLLATLAEKSGGAVVRKRI